MIKFIRSPFLPVKERKETQYVRIAIAVSVVKQLKRVLLTKTILMLRNYNRNMKHGLRWR